MANRYAVKSGNWSDPATWNGGTLPGAEDVVRPNGFTVEIDQDIEVIALRANASAPIVSGGTFSIVTVEDTRIIRADINLPGTSATVVTINASSGDIVIYGNLQAYLTASKAVLHNSTAFLHIIGNVIGGDSANQAHGLVVGGAATVVIDGFVMSPASWGYPPYGVYVTAAANITINGDVIGGASHGFYSTAGCILTVNGDVYGSTLAGGGSGIYCTHSAAIIDINGAVVGSLSAAGAYLLGPTQVRVRGPLVHASNYRAPLLATHWAVHAGVNTSWQALDDAAYPNGNPIVLTNYVSDSPPPADVREGTVYGADNSLTGTMKVPPPSAVRHGVAVDGTVGTAALEVDDIASAVGAQIQGVLNG